MEYTLIYFSFHLCYFIFCWLTFLFHSHHYHLIFFYYFHIFNFDFCLNFDFTFNFCFKIRFSYFRLKILVNFSGKRCCEANPLSPFWHTWLKVFSWFTSCHLNFVLKALQWIISHFIHFSFITTSHQQHSVIFLYILYIIFFKSRIHMSSLSHINVTSFQFLLFLSVY